MGSQAEDVEEKDVTTVKDGLQGKKKIKIDFERVYGRGRAN